MTSMHQSRSVASFLALLLLFSTTPLASQAPQRTPLGALRATGEVYVNDSTVTGETTIFTGDALRTGAGGAARLTISGRGSLIVSSQTRISFEADPRYFAVLRQGSAGLRSLPGARNFQLRVGSFIVVPDPTGEAAAEVVLVADGSARVTCTAGSCGVIEVEGAQAAFLRPGETANISAAGALQVGAPPPTPTAPTPVPTGQRKSRKGLYLLLGIGGGAGAATAAALAASGGGPASPSTR